MPVQVTTAIISVVGVLLSASIAAYFSWRNARLIRQTAHEVELLRLEQERQRAHYEHRQVLLTRQADAVGILGAALQKAREELRGLSANGFAFTGTKAEDLEAIRRAIAACEELRDRYGESWTSLPKSLRSLFHRVKGCLMQIRKGLQSLVEDQDSLRPASRSQVLKGLRDDLRTLNRLYQNIADWIDYASEHSLGGPDTPRVTLGRETRQLSPPDANP